MAGLAFTGAAAHDAAAATAGTENFPTLNRRAQVAPNAEFEHLKALARRNGSVRVIVGLRVAFTPEGALPPAAQEAQHRSIASASAAVRQVLIGTDYHVARTFELVPLIVLELSEGAITRLQASGLAATLWIDSPRPPPTMADGITAQPAGRGGAVAILDTGVDRAALRTAKVVNEACFSAHGDCPNGTTQQIGLGSGRPCTYAPGECQHGTQAAHLAASNPRADIVAIQVFSRFTGEQCGSAAKPCARSFESDHIAGLQYVFRLHNTVEIGAARMSLGTGTFSLGCDGNPLKLAIDNLRSVGIPTLIPSGTGGSANAADVPRCISAAMTVGTNDGSAGAVTANIPPPAAALPDLVVTAGALRISAVGSHRSLDFSVRGPGLERKIEWGHTTANLQDAGHATRAAGRSMTGLEFQNTLTTVLMDGLRVPKLGPGEDDVGATQFTIGFETFDYGTYFTRICADASNPPLVTERDESNNCKEMAPFYVIPFLISGNVTGTWQTIEGATVSWKAAVEFESSPDDPHGVFHYVLNTRTSSVKFKLSGNTTISGHVCTWSGKATYRPVRSDDGITLDFGTDSYSSQILLPQGFTLPGVLTCPGIGTIPSPVDMSGSPWLDTGSGQQFLDPGLTPLQGQFVDSLVTFTWDLQGVDFTPVSP